MLSHSEFMDWLRMKFQNTSPSQLQDIALKTVNGVAPAESITMQVESVSHVAVQAFAFGKTSLERLSHLRVELRMCFMEAIKISLVDMTIIQTIRSIEEQRRNIANGASRTMKSKHLPQPPHGLADAADAAAFVNGKISWDESHYADIAFAMDQAATKLGFATHVRWGAAWDRVLADFGGSRDAYLAEARAYAKRHAGSDLIDMPHFEWVA